MTENSASLEDMLKKYTIQIHDLEYILNFMQKESISPQLAMRRIKLFEKLQEKMSQTQSNDKVKELTSELDHLSKMVEELQSEKTKLDKEIEDTRLEQDLFNAEREELKLQMHALMGSIESIETEAEEEEEKLEEENQTLKKKISVMTAGCQTLKDRVLEITSENASLRPLAQGLEKSLEIIMEGNQIPNELGISVPKEIIAKQPVEIPSTKAESTPAPSRITETISPDQVKFVAQTPVSETKPSTQSTESISASTSSIPVSKPPVEIKESSVLRKPVIKEKLFADIDEIDRAVSAPAKESQPAPEAESKPAPTPKPRPKHVEEDRPAKISVSSKPSPEGNQVSAKTEKILRLFISYAEQADTDENWKARIAAICDMDEAYIELGGLAMSQVYSYQTQTLKKRKEFQRLLNSWIENGLPR
ncbi:MAG: hypothetical protein KGD64_00835 [Candidatus Heimdallarchaeota archaeon]|nr:hypothetical protein [Candidatus Heimdallarchaeota archaeon]